MGDFAIDFESALVWFDCVLCNGTGMHGPEPCECSCGSDAVYIGTWLMNLAIGAALCRAFRVGYDAGWDDTGEGFNGEYAGPSLTAERYETLATFGRPDHLLAWRPGCQRPAPGERREG